jgi:hypothetical protein
MSPLSSSQCQRVQAWQAFRVGYRMARAAASMASGPTERSPSAELIFNAGLLIFNAGLRLSPTLHPTRI